MNRRSFLKSANLAGLAIALPSSTFARPNQRNRLPQAVPESENHPAERTIAHSPSTKFLVTASRQGQVPHHRHALPSLREERSRDHRLAQEHGRMQCRKNHDPHHDDGKGVRRYLCEIFEVSRALRSLVRPRSHWLQQARIRPRRRQRNSSAAAKRALADIGEIHDKGQGLRSGKSSAPECTRRCARGCDLGKGRRTSHAGQPACRRSHLDVSAHGQAQRRPDERLRMAPRQPAEHRQAFRHGRILERTAAATAIRHS